MPTIIGKKKKKLDIEVAPTIEGTLIPIAFRAEYAEWVKRQQLAEELKQEHSDGEDLPIVAKLKKNAEYQKLFEEIQEQLNGAISYLEPYSGAFQGREENIEAIVETVCNNQEKTRMILGNAGEGKTTLVRQVVRLLNEGKIENKMGYELVPIELSLMSILQLGEEAYLGIMAYLVPTLKRLEKGAREYLNNPNIKLMVFIDEIHMISKAIQNESGESTGVDVLKRYLEPRYDNIILLGATTRKEYDRYIVPNPPFVERFIAVTELRPFNREELVKLLRNQWSYLRGLRGLEVRELPEDLIRYILKTNQKHILDSAEPRKSKQLLSLIETKSFTRGVEPSLELVNEVYKQDKSINPALKPDVKGTIEAIENNIVGQFPMKAAMKRSLTSYVARKDHGNTLGSFLFLGPTGVGKTETAKQMAHHFFGDEGHFEFISCPNYSSIPNGALGLMEKLRETVQHHKSTLFLFDEVEKSFPSVAYDKVLSPLRDLFLEITGEGRLVYRDSRGDDHIVSFKNCLFVFTSNAGYELAEVSDDFASFTADADTAENRLLKELDDKRGSTDDVLHDKYGFPREFLGRQKGQPTFSSILEADACQLLDRLLDKWVNRIQRDFDIEVLLDEKQDFDAERLVGVSESRHTFYPLSVTLATAFANFKDSGKGGARQLTRAIENNLDYIIGQLILEGKETSVKRIEIFPQKIHAATGDVIKNDEIQKEIRKGGNVSSGEVKITWKEVS